MKRFWLAMVCVGLGVVPARAGLFDRGIGSAMEYGPYTGGHAYSYNVAYSYFFSPSPADTWRLDPLAYPAGVYPYRPNGQPILYRVFPKTPCSVPPISVPGEDGLPVLVNPGIPPTSLNLPPGVVPAPLPVLNAVPAGSEARPATIRVVVPQNAEVWLEKEKTSQTGTDRAFVLPPLATGKLHVYTVRAAWTENGRAVEQVRVVGIKAGETAKVNFLVQR
jgi:uncharacterized protein (TIGR03000 family)